MEEEFKSELELYERVRPALSTKKDEMRRNGFNYIQEEDIWNYLKEVKWIKSNDLALHEMVDNILNCDEYIIDNYLKEKLNRGNRKVYFDTE